MGVQLDEGEASVGLEARFDDVAKVLEERHQVILRGVRRQVANIARRLPSRRLVHHHLIAVDTLGREMVVAKRRGRGHADLLQGLLLCHGRLALLVGPVAADRARPEPLAIHGAQRLLGIWAVAEGHEAISPRPACLHVPHDPGFGDRSKRRKGLRENLVVDLVRQIAHKDVEVTRGVLLACRVRLVGPVDPDFLNRSVNTPQHKLSTLSQELWARQPLDTTPTDW